MINFDAVDFSECRAKRGISFFWRSVYLFSYDNFTQYKISYNDSLHAKWINLNISLDKLSLPIFLNYN